MIRRIASIFLLAILPLLPAAAMVGQFCHYESGIECCDDESGCPMPVYENESDQAMGIDENCLEMCACTIERRGAPVGVPAENPRIAGDSPAHSTVAAWLSSNSGNQLNHIRPPIISDRGETYLEINCLRI